MVQTELFDNPKRRTVDRIEKLVNYAERFGRGISFADGYAEPGYDGDMVVFGNWNKCSHWDRNANRHVFDNNVMPRIAKLLEKLGYEVEWEDKWTTCDCCGKAVRVQPDSYSWAPYYHMIGDCAIICNDCYIPEETQDD